MMDNYQKSDFYSNVSLRNDRNLVIEYFKKDPSMLVFFKDYDLTNDNIDSAINRGYIPSKDDLFFNKCFRNITKLMDRAVSNNPELIKYAGARCYFSPVLLDDVFSKYNLTRDDILNNPDLRLNFSIMSYSNELKMYSSFLTVDDKSSAIYECLLNNDASSILNFPFFDSQFDCLISSDCISKVLDLLLFNVDIDDMDFQQKYYKILNKLIDGIISIRYSNKKSSFLYYDSVSLYEAMLVSFNSNNCNDFIDTIFNFIGGSLDIDLVKKNILSFYDIYCSTGFVDFSSVTYFFNFVLNQHRNLFYSNERNLIIDNLSFVMELSPKKKKLVLNRHKLYKINFYIQKKDFKSLGVSNDDFYNKLLCTVDEIINNKYIKSLNCNFNSCELTDFFMNNIEMSLNDISSYLGINDDEAALYICKKFEKFKLQFSNNIVLSDSECNISSFEKSKFKGLNYNDFLIFDLERYYINISNILARIDFKSFEHIFSNKCVDEIICLLPFVDLFPELNVDTFINILSFFDIAKERIIDFSNDRSILNKVDDLITLCDGYSSVDSLDLFALGRDIVSCVGKIESKAYVDFYLKMLYRKNSNIPPICFSDDDFSYESGVLADPERLLIGHKLSAKSCIHIGTKSYKELLVEPTGDVILVRDKNKNLVSRILLFRRGNLIQIVSNLNTKFSINVYEKICSELVKNLDKNDTIDYIFLNSSCCLKCRYPYFEDSRFVTKFPHADFYNKAFVLWNRNGLDVKLDFDCSSEIFYPKRRMDINYSPLSDDIDRIKALNVIMNGYCDCDFLPFYPKEYSCYVCGEDWYFALKNDGSIEELVLPLNDDYGTFELSNIKSDLLNNYKK